MTSIEHLQPIRAVRPPRRPSPFRPALLFAAGFFGAAALLTAALLALHWLFPPSRTNILIIGTDRRPGQSGPGRADTLMLATIDPARPYAGLLSIPRDLWVRLPDGSENRINAAYFLAEARATGSGPQAAVETVASNFGTHLDGYTVVDLAGFVRVIDAVGGVTVNVPAPIVDHDFPTYDYGTQTVAFAAGEQHMSGERALQYARIRHGSSDFLRAKRQQAVLVALGQRMLEPTAWPRLPLFYAAVVSSVDTNVSTLEAVRLFPALLAIGPSGVDRRVIEGNMVEPFTTAGGAAVQRPVWERIHPLVREVLGE